MSERTSTQTPPRHRRRTDPQTTGDSADDASPPEGDSTPPTDSATPPTGAESEAPATETTGAQAIVAALEAAGVEHVFGVQGGAIMPVYDALYDADITHITMAHEQGAAHAADAYGQVTGRPGICMATSGPGATNLVTGLADADMDSDPLVALTGQVPTAFVGNDAFQETDTVGVTRPVTKTNFFAGDVDTVGTTVGDAIALAGDGRPGPTLVDLPKDVTTGETTADASDAPKTPTDTDEPPAAEPGAVATAARALAAADRPLILSGGGVTKGEASDELRAFATEFGIPVTTTMPGIGTFPEDHDRSLSWAGMHGTGYANMAISHTDCMLAVGTRFDDRLTGGIETFAPDAEVIHIDIDPAEISKNVHADHPLVGDAGTILEQLHEAMADTFSSMERRVDDYEPWCEQCTEWKETYQQTYDTAEDAPLKPQFVVEAMDELTPDDTIVTTGVGQHQMWAAQFWTYTEPRTYISSHGLGTMGYGLPATIGAKVAAPETDVVCFDGDGSFLMTVQELAVAVRENLDVTVVVLNNEAIGMVRQWQDAFFEGRRMASEYSWVPDFAMLAEAFGAKGFTLETYDDTAETLRSALDYDGPSVVDAHIDPTENVYPIVPSGGDNSRFALSEDQL